MQPDMGLHRTLTYPEHRLTYHLQNIEPQAQEQYLGLTTRNYSFRGFSIDTMIVIEK